MKSIDRIDQQPTAVDQPLLRLRHVYQDRRSGKDRRRGVTCMDPAMDRRKGERRQSKRHSKDRQIAAARTLVQAERRNGEHHQKVAWFLKR